MSLPTELNIVRLRELNSAMRGHLQRLRRLVTGVDAGEREVCGAYAVLAALSAEVSQWEVRLGAARQVETPVYHDRKLAAAGDHSLEDD